MGVCKQVKNSLQLTLRSNTSLTKQHLFYKES